MSMRWEGRLSSSASTFALLVADRAGTISKDIDICIDIRSPIPVLIPRAEYRYFLIDFINLKTYIIVSLCCNQTQFCVPRCVLSSKLFWFSIELLIYFVCSDPFVIHIKIGRFDWSKLKVLSVEVDGIWTRLKYRYSIDTGPPIPIKYRYHFNHRFTALVPSLVLADIVGNATDFVFDAVSGTSWQGVQLGFGVTPR